MRWLPVLMTVLLIGCSGTKTAEPDGATVFPARYKDQLLQSVPKVLDDPTNIKDGFVTEPFQIKVSGATVYAVCMRGNPRDANRKYTGNVELVAYFYAGQINQLIAAPPEVCSKAAYKPFPELEKLCRGDRCS